MSGSMSDCDSFFLDAAPTMKEDSMIELMHMSKEFDLIDLARRTEDALKPMITRKRFQNDASTYRSLIHSLTSATFRQSRLVIHEHQFESETRSNCVKFYQLAEEIESKVLIDYTGNIVSENWDQLGPEELASGRVSKIQYVNLIGLLETSF